MSAPPPPPPPRFRSSSEQVCLDGRVGLSVEGGQNPGERAGKTVRRLPGLQDLLGLDRRLRHGQVGRAQAGPAGRLQALQHRGPGGIEVAPVVVVVVVVVVVGRGRARAQAGRAAHVPAGRAGQRGGAVRRGAAGGLLGLVVVGGGPPVAGLLPPGASGARGPGGAAGLGVGGALLLPELGAPVLEPHLVNTEGSLTREEAAGTGSVRPAAPLTWTRASVKSILSASSSRV